MTELMPLTRPTAATHRRQARRAERRRVTVPGRLVWRDSRGTLRFASVTTRDVSDHDCFVVCEVPAVIPMYRLVHFQVERSARDCVELPEIFRNGKVLGAVYRVGSYRPSTGTPQGYALRLLVDPGQRRFVRPQPQVEAPRLAAAY